MTLDIPSFLSGLIVCAFIAGAWMFGQQSAIRLARRVSRHGKDLDRVFFEDAERDATIRRPEPLTAEIHDLRESKTRASER